MNANDTRHNCYDSKIEWGDWGGVGKNAILVPASCSVHILKVDKFVHFLSTFWLVQFDFLAC
jgi:hypothetical protein